MMRISEVEQFFEDNVDKKTLTEISLDKDNDISLINSDDYHFDFDQINFRIKTSDTLFFSKSNIIFVEFKKGKTIKDIDLRLKATESIISLVNFLIEKQILTSVSFPSDVFHLYFVYDRNNISSIQVNELGKTERKLQAEYKNIIAKYQIINQDSFKKRFKIK